MATAHTSPVVGDAVLAAGTRVSSQAGKRAIAALLTSRQNHEIAARQIDQNIWRLSQLGVTQRDIAALAGISQAEISRRLKRRALTADVDRLRDIVQQRSSGELDSAQMVDALALAVKSRRRPGRISAYDGVSTSSPATTQLMNLYRAGTISRSEYEAVRRRIAQRVRRR